MPERKRADPTPAELYGPLLAAVQERGILRDGKTFVDALPKRAVADIMADFATAPLNDADLLCFVEQNFELPVQVGTVLASPTSRPLREHIRAMWSQLARGPEAGALNSSALPVGHRHVVPGGRFREIYYWDSFFTMLGLVRDGELDLATGIVDAMTELIEDHGHVPNGTRTYYLGRSQPPLFHMMVALLHDDRPDVVARRLAAMKREHAWWMEGADTLSRGRQTNRVAMLSDGSILNRYWDPRGTPRDESWGEDVATAQERSRPADAVYRDLRAGAESGWDFSSRWLDGPSLSSIRTTTIAPVDLNSFLYGLESAIAAAGDVDAAPFAQRAQLRMAAMHRHLWYSEGGYFADFDLVSGVIRPALTAATLAPLLAGLATPEQAEATAQVVEDRMLAPGGLRTTLVESGEQWDVPNGWAPLQWIAVNGLRRYGQTAVAEQIKERWLATVEKVYACSGSLFEKYDIETGEIGGQGEYALQTGFGWTNGVTADFMDEIQKQITRRNLESGVHEGQRLTI